MQILDAYEAHDVDVDIAKDDPGYEFANGDLVPRYAYYPYVLERHKPEYMDEFSPFDSQLVHMGKDKILGLQLEGRIP